MRLAIIQLESKIGDLSFNIRKHQHALNILADQDVDLVLFPELSLTGYCLLKGEKIQSNSSELQLFEKLAKNLKTIICIGYPILKETRNYISMLIFEPDGGMEIYNKIILHPDEYPHYSAGDKQIIINSKGNNFILGICYEALNEQHLINGINRGGNIYLVSASKTQEGAAKTHEQLAFFSKKYNIPILFCNSIGQSEGFVSAGKSAIWDSNGNMLASLNGSKDKYIVYDIKKNKLIKYGNLY